MNLDAPHAIVTVTVAGFELVGAAAITLGSVLACGRFAFLHKNLDLVARYRALRQELGSAIVLGLEFLVAADIIRTVVMDPTLESVAILGLIVLIRTFLSMALQMEIHRAWPWSPHGTEAPGIGSDHGRESGNVSRSVGGSPR